ncbi:hypothetical protein FFLO_05643 [Filobasidium floriforme]|uniref:asparaginase n=1 Tax=Filobasidium floriforme TaxID=5210 RepID=A0A8K0JI70_9TREE|nr:asparaginase [Filobasidium floriforme]KAG7529467.1 hypothetical protein FFLO_05643 [Filobasidium floriforme]KAH8088474.1 asparaginase [Filobasidium floriforme]
MFGRSLITLLAASAAQLAIALPLEARANSGNSSFLPTDIGLNITYSGPHNASLPNVAIFATGGTIAGSSSSELDTTSYTAGVVGIAALIEAVPQLLDVANVQGSQIINIASESLNSTIVLQIAKFANAVLCAEGSTTDGLVITHGTDTLEETAFLMDSVVNCGKPVVLVGAMRPSTAISADGPANLLEAVTLAGEPDARDRGALIALNDRIGSALYTQKNNANTINTFTAVEQGNIGGFLSTKPFFYYPAGQPTFKETFDISSVNELPMVDVLYGHQSFDWKLIQEAIDNGAKGIVIAGTGAGSLSDLTIIEVERLLKQGFPIVASTKINEGAVPAGRDWISAGFLNPVKARIRLQLAIATGLDMNGIRAKFENTLVGYLDK